MAFDKTDPETIAFIEEMQAGFTKELRAAKAKASKGSDIDPAEFARIQNELEDLTGKLNTSGKVSKAETEKLVKALAEKDTALSAYLIDAGISGALSAAGVAKQYVKPLMSMFKADAKVKAEDGKYSAVIGDKDLAMSIGEFLQSDDGKHFVAAPNSSGGGARGNTSTQSSQKKFSDLTSGERAALFKSDPTAFFAAAKV